MESRDTHQTAQGREIWQQKGQSTDSDLGPMQLVYWPWSMMGVLTFFADCVTLAAAQ